MSFSLFGLLFTFVTGALIVVTSYALEPVLGWFHRRRRYQQYAHLEWLTNGSHHLHRLAHEGLDDESQWLRCDVDIPITKPAVHLAHLDITDLSHPLLRKTSAGPSLACQCEKYAQVHSGEPMEGHPETATVTSEPGGSSTTSGSVESDPDESYGANGGRGDDTTATSLPAIVSGVGTKDIVAENYIDPDFSNTEHSGNGA